MTWIMMEPEELTTVASLLRQVATRLEGLTGEVQAACCNCCASSGVDQGLAGISTSVGRDLSDVGSGCRADAARLDGAATVISNDSSLGSSVSAAWGTTIAPTSASAPSNGGFGTGDWLAGMDSSTPGIFAEPALDGWVDQVVGTTPADLAAADMAAASLMPQVEPTGPASNNAGMTVAGMMGLVPTWSQIWATEDNATHNLLVDGNYLDDTLSGEFSGTETEWLTQNGYDMDDPYVDMNA
jgi:hypothetical protein